jgi:rsbT co-antagonist protein RsbR
MDDAIDDTTDGPGQGTVTLERSRLARVQEVLGRLSVGDAGGAADKIDVKEDDDFAAFEEMLNIFADEYGTAMRENEEMTRQRLEIIERQQAAIADLSVPVIDVWDDIVMLPIVGVVDTKRSVEMTQRLLRRVAQGDGRCVIIDLTGIDVVDTSAADHLIRMMRSVQLLGSHCVISGISPNIAQTLVQLDVDVGDTAIVRNLKDALLTCFRVLEDRRAKEAR